MNAMQHTRRSILKSAALGAGATLLAPAITRIAAHAAGDATNVSSRRVVFVMQSNGINPMHLVPKGMSRNANGKNTRPDNDTLQEVSLKDKEFGPAIEPLQAFRDRVAIVQGLSGAIAKSDHSANWGALGACPANKGPMLQTIDSAIADALPAVFQHVAVGYGGSLDPMCYSYSASGPGKAVPIITSADLAYKSLFGSVASGSGKQAFDRRSHLLDFMADDVRRTRNAVTSEDRQKLDHYVEAYDVLSARQRRLVEMGDQLKKHAPQLGEKQTSNVSSLIVEAQFEIATAALVAGLTNTVTLTSGGGGQRFGKYPEFGIPDLHGIGHGASYNGKTSEECFIELRRFHTRLIARLCERLAAVPEGSGTMLDNTLIVYLSDSGESHHPGLLEWPLLLIGNLGGRMKTAGRYLQFPGYGTARHRTMANFYTTLLHAVGKPRDAFGVPDPKLKDIDQHGTIQELLV